MKQQESLPKWAGYILKAICPARLLEEVEGDLIQRFNRHCLSHGMSRARRKLLVDIIKYLRPGIFLRHTISFNVNGFSMLRNYILSSYRHVLKFKLNAAFKLVGLTLAVFSLLIIAMYVSYHLSFDRYHRDYERIFRVNTERTENGIPERYGIAPLAFGQILSDGFPEIESYARIAVANRSDLKFNGKVVWGGVFQADSSLFDVLTFTFIEGDRRALREPGSIVLTRSLAKKIFNETSPLHQVLTINNGEQLFKVTAIIEDMPDNAHFRVDAFTLLAADAPFNINNIVSPPEFVDNASMLYVKLRPLATKASFLTRLENTLDKSVSKKIRKELGFKIYLQPLANLYLDPPLKYEFTRKGSTLYLYIFSLLGFFLLSIACINYTNLSLVNFLHRAREMGVRKIMGGGRREVVVQIIIETLLYCVTSLLLSVLLLYAVFPSIKEVIDPALTLSMLLKPGPVLIGSVALFALLTASAILPASWFVNSNVIADLKGAYGAGRKIKANVVLLYVQFAISAICISATLTVGKQMTFIHQKDLGLDRRNLLVLTMPEDFTKGKMIQLKSALREIPEVVNASNSSFRITGGYWKDWYTVEVGNEMQSFELYEVFSDDDLFATLGMTLKAGRLFNADNRADSGAAFVINETAVRALGLEEPVGKRILTHPEDSGKWEGTIVGVVNDIHINTLHHKVQPLVMRLPWQNEYPEYFVYVRVSEASANALHAIRATYHEIQPGYPLELEFVDDYYNGAYAAERKAFTSLQFATLIILVISSLGIFSLSMYMSARRMKEFGIRKVLGATIPQIVFVNVGHFLKIAMVASAIALPLSYLMMEEWLGGFAYQTNIGIGLFVWVFIIVLVMTILSTGFVAVSAAKVNPVDAIRKL
ncbi:MAG TPA: FtsX-like permease family protein [Ohtaekwangia sp.]|nr:FtsX-like permease family protein [Ohtaekwangia sp.]